MEEVEWLASYAYNQSIDLYIRGEAEHFRHWSQRAIELARYCDDDGRFQGLLQEKLVQLRLDGVP